MRRVIAILAFCLADLYITGIIIREFGLEMELNPVVRWMVRDYGMSATYWARGISVFMAGAFLAWAHYKKKNQSADRMLTLAFWLSLSVLAWHGINYTMYWLT